MRRRPEKGRGREARRVPRPVGQVAEAVRRRGWRGWPTSPAGAPRRSPTPRSSGSSPHPGKTKPKAATHWSTRSWPAAACRSPRSGGSGGRSASSRTRARLQAVDRPYFVDKVRDIVGLYLDPPEGPGALRRREDPGPGPGPHPAALADDARQARAGARHDYVRHGTTSLFAALDVATGEVIGQCHRRHRPRSSSSSSSRSTPAVPPSLEIHLVLDNYATHKTPAVKRGSCATRGTTCTSRRPAARG